MKIAILYVSITGNTEKAAGYIQEGICEAGGIDVRLMNLAREETLDLDFIKDSRAVIFGTPTYVANISWQIKKGSIRSGAATSPANSGRLLPLPTPRMAEQMWQFCA